MRSLSFTCAFGESLRFLTAFFAAAASLASLVSSLVSTVFARAELFETLATFFLGAAAFFLIASVLGGAFLAAGLFLAGGGFLLGLSGVRSWFIWGFPFYDWGPWGPWDPGSPGPSGPRTPSPLGVSGVYPRVERGFFLGSVSYTHLTLPTTPYV